MKCPVCNKEIPTENHKAYRIDHVVEEEHITCSEHYQYDFEYGYAVERIGDISVATHYSDDFKTNQLKGKILNLALQLAKENNK